MKKLIFILICVMTVALNAQSGKFLHAQGTQIVDSTGHSFLLRGFGLGGWLVPEGYMLHIPGFGSPTSIREKIIDLIGMNNTIEFYKRYEANYIRKADIDSLGKYGINSIRLPFHYKNFYDPDSGGFIQKGFKITDNLLSWCKVNNMYLILDMHCAPGGQNKDNISDSDGVEARLWTEPANQELMIAIWKRIAAYYADETTIGGYDLLNETVLPEGYSSVDFRNFYVRLTDSIRQVDTNHLLFIEGNWYANDFTNLTPPWDSNMAYSFHKYWNNTDQSSLNFVTSIRSAYNVPLWLGETGENSNVWFSKVVQLSESNNIGWCWWTNKKINTLTSPYSVPITDGYQTVLNYWNGSASRPSAGYATAALLQIADNLKIEACDRRPGVLRALLDPEYDDISKPFASNTIPGDIPAVNYDFGSQAVAYSDADYYNVTTHPTQNYNSGGGYRNDGVDIEACSDPQGPEFNVGWTETGEWIYYTVEAESSGVYRLTFRVASNVSGSQMVPIMDGKQLPVVNVPSTGGWQNWINVNLDSISISAGQHKFRLLFLNGGININKISFEILVNDINGENSMPHTTRLEGNYPNPFNPGTKIQFTMAKRGKVTLTIYNSMGQKIGNIFTGIKPAGTNEVLWEPKELPSGIYICELRSGSSVSRRKMVLLK